MPHAPRPRDVPRTMTFRYSTNPSDQHQDTRSRTASHATLLRDPPWRWRLPCMHHVLALILNNLRLEQIES